MKRGALFNPARVLVIGFAGVIALGTFLLTLGFATVDGRGLPVIDAFFTATSAVCVTGLTVVNIGAVLTTFGQVVVMLLIQVGGLGVMTITSLFVYAVRRRISLRDSVTVGEALGQTRLTGAGRLVRNVVLVTVVVEAAGALLLTAAWSRGYPVGQALYLGVFHSVSAFCNAGFDLFGRSLVDYAGNITVNLTIMGLIVIGGLGFVVIEELLGAGWRAVRAGRRGPAGLGSASPSAANGKRLSLHTRLVLVTTTALIVLGTLAVLALEYRNPGTLGPLPAGQKVLAAAFAAVTPRTAGFNTVAVASLLGPTLLLTIVLMFIGASPGSTGGGIKTTTLATIIATIRSALRGREAAEIGGRRLSTEVTMKAWVITALALGLVVVGVFILLGTEQLPLMDLTFEAVSAFGTVGLSTGITPQLSVVGRLVIPLLMFAGRVGPLTLAVALARRRPEGADWRLAEERIIVG